MSWSWKSLYGWKVIGGWGIVVPCPFTFVKDSVDVVWF